MVKTNSILFLVNLVFGVYLLNKGLNFVTLPEFILNIENIIFVIGGGLLVVSGFMSMSRARTVRR